MRGSQLGEWAICRRSLAVWIGFLALLLCAVPVRAQVDQGTISGTVSDPSGAVVPNAQVTLTDIQTGLVLSTKSNQSGTYVFSPIKIGSYTVSASAQGFATVTLSGLVVNVNQRLLANLKLTPGNLSQTVNVQAGAEQLLQTEQSSTGQTISTQVINDTPLNGRNYVFVAQLTAGVAPIQGRVNQHPSDQ